MIYPPLKGIYVLQAATKASQHPTVSIRNHGSSVVYGVSGSIEVTLALFQAYNPN